MTQRTAETWKTSDPWEILQAHQFALINQTASLTYRTDFPLFALAPEELEADPDLMPALLPLEPGKPYMAALAQNMEEAKEEPKRLALYGLLAVGEAIEPPRLQAHLANRLVARLASGGKAYVRYFDPTVYPKLARIIPPPRWSLLHGPIVRWSIPFYDKWISFFAPEVEHKAAAWIITEEQWARVERIRFINDALMEHEVILERPWESFEEYSQATEVAERALSTAQRLYGIKDRGDLLVYTVNALVRGEHFHRYPPIQNLLRNPPPEGHGAALTKLDETIWVEAQAYACSHY